MTLRLTRPQSDRGTEYIAAVIARPVVVDTPCAVEAGFLRHQQNAAAAGAFRPAQILGRRNSCRCSWLARGLDDHRRSSSTHPHRTLQAADCPPYVAQPRRRRETVVAFMDGTAIGTGCRSG